MCPLFLQRFNGDPIDFSYHVSAPVYEDDLGKNSGPRSDDEESGSEKQSHTVVPRHSPL